MLALGWLLFRPDDALLVSTGFPNDPVQCTRKRRDAFPCVPASDSSTWHLTYFYPTFPCTGYMIVPGTKDEPILPPGMKAHLHADLDQSFDF